MNLDVSALTHEQRPTGLWAAALLHALARDETAGRRPQRLTEPRLDTWSRFRGRLNAADFIALLFEDAAVLHPIPFDAAALANTAALANAAALSGTAALSNAAPSSNAAALTNAATLSNTIAELWLRTIPSLPLTAPPSDYVTSQAQFLGVTTALALSDLPMVKPHQKVLELPGTGGQLAHHILTAQPGLSLHDNFAVACASFQELTLAGIVALELGAPHTEFVTHLAPADLATPEHPLRQRTFDFVVGLHPKKGGLFREENLAIWFPSAKIVWV